MPTHLQGVMFAQGVLKSLTSDSHIVNHNYIFKWWLEWVQGALKLHHIVLLWWAHINCYKESQHGPH